MPRKRSPERDRAKQIWEADKSRSLISIAEEMGVPEHRIRKWKYEDKWEPGGKGTYRNTQKARTETKKLAAMVEQNEALNDKQKLFCLLYVKSFNATRAYQKAYNSSYENAHAHAWELLAKESVRAEIQCLKEARSLSLMADGTDVIMLHMRIAFADMTDFVTFRRFDVELHSSAEVDGQLITKVKQGRDGVSMELADRQKSLAFLERYFELNPADKHKKDYDNARLELEKQKQHESTTVEDLSALAEMLNDDE